MAFDPRATPITSEPAVRTQEAAGPAAAAEPEVLPPEEVERVAGFVRPKSYLYAPLYALRVLRRLGPLRRELAARRHEETRAAQLRREAFAQWARSHSSEMAADPAMKPALDAVDRANRTLEGFLATRRSELDRFRLEDEALAEEEKAASAERAKLAGELAAQELILRDRSAATARARAKVRRAEIELRNLRRLAQGNLGPSSPHAGRAAELQQACAGAAAELSQAQAEETASREEVARLRSRMEEIERQLEARRAKIRSNPVRRRFEEDHEALRRTAEDMLARATAQALARKILPPESPEVRQLEALDAAEQLAVRARRLVEAAIGGIDRKMVIVGVAIPTIALVLLVVVLWLLR